MMITLLNLCDKYVGVFIVILRVANAYDGNLRWERLNKNNNNK